jgi:hypothetical protein
MLQGIVFLTLLNGLEPVNRAVSPPQYFFSIVTAFAFDYVGFNSPALIYLKYITIQILFLYCRLFNSSFTIESVGVRWLDD